MNLTLFTISTVRVGCGEDFKRRLPHLKGTRNEHTNPTLPGEGEVRLEVPCSILIVKILIKMCEHFSA